MPIISNRAALLLSVAFFCALLIVFSDLRGSSDTTTGLHHHDHEDRSGDEHHPPRRTPRAPRTSAPAIRDDDDDGGTATTKGGNIEEPTEDLDETVAATTQQQQQQQQQQQEQATASATDRELAARYPPNSDPLRTARLREAARRPLDPKLLEWQHEDAEADGALYNVTTSANDGDDNGKKRKFVSTLRWMGKCWYRVTNFCVVKGELTLYHDPATDKSVRRDSLRMCNEFSQRSPQIRLKYRSVPMPAQLPGPLLTKTPGWVLQFWCQDLFHSTLSLLPAFHTKKKHMPFGGLQSEPDIYLKLARGRRKKGQYCHIKFGHPLSYNESHNDRWGGDKQFPFAGNPYWSMYGVLSKSPWRMHPLYAGATQKTACYTEGVIDKLYIKDMVRTQAREYSDAMLENLGVEKAPRRECGKYRMTIIDRRGKTRRLTNIDNITKIARRVGFEIVRAVAFEFLTLQQQIRLITDTDLLFGVHGNGLIWQQFLEQGSCLIELVHTWYQPYAKLFGHSYYHSSIGKNPFYKKHGEYVPFAHNETEIEELLVKAKASLDSTSCGVTQAINMNEKLDMMYAGCAPHC